MGIEASAFTLLTALFLLFLLTNLSLLLLFFIPSVVKIQRVLKRKKKIFF